LPAGPLSRSAADAPGLVRALGASIGDPGPSARVFGLQTVEPADHAAATMVMRMAGAACASARE
jgi:hypothetical protein